MAVEAVELVVTALTAGAAAGMKDTATSAVKDAYAALVAAVRGRLNHEQAAIVDDPGNHWETLTAALAGECAGDDQELVAAAHALLAQLDPEGTRAGKYTIDVQDSKAIQIGDGNTMNVTF